jgi:pyruvate-ferredoxin/flavodoxin oxidoreductase
MANETRFGILKNVDPERAAMLGTQAQKQVIKHYQLYQQLAAPVAPAVTNGKPATPAVAPAAPSQS